MRRGVQSRAWSLLPSIPPLGRPADRGRMGLSVPPTLNFVGESWTAPVDVERVRPAQDANEVATEQVKALLRLPHEYEEEEEGAAPLFVFDAGYDPVKVQQGLKGTPCQILIRLRSGRFYADPSLASPPAHTGRPRRHGPKTKCSDPSTCPQPSTGYTFEDSGYGTVRVCAWAKLHPKVCSHEGRGSWGPLPIVVGTLVLVEAERLPRGETEHGTDHTSGVRHPEQADRWTWLVVATFTQLRLARTCVADLRLPWVRRYDSGRLRPVRVHRVVSPLLAQLGTPAKPPKPCGRSPGRPKGRLSGQARRYPALKKTA
jgi:hypothetical protein